MKLTLKNTDADKIYKSGQCFTITVSNDEYWFYSIGRACCLKQRGKDCLMYCKSSDLDFWKDFFNLSINFDFIRKLYMDCYPDFITKEVLKASEGLILLNQEHFPCLISFITSQRKSVSAIRNLISEFCYTYGNYKQVKDLLDPNDEILNTTILEGLYLFPTLNDALNKVSLDSLTELGFGYRSTYIYEAIHNFVEPSYYRDKSYAEAFNKLQSYFGVGVKIANCVALYSLGYFDAYPRDIWIQRFEEEFYGGLFDEEGCEGYAGIVQLWQYYYMLNR